ncbi:MAG TPA: gliding motility lipoprotein GldH [Hanamia sp.]|nr:gliding motility lipoprotein GldH [Hanamia sp.]
MKLSLLILLSLFIFSCGKIDLFEKQAQIPSQQWFYNNVPQFTFHIKDTTSHYNIYLVLRHTDLYNYNNIWLRLGSKAPGDSMKFQNINLKLASDAKGWEGVGMDDIFEVRKNITPGPVSFKTAGDYTFSIAQIMRDNPLKYIMNVGLRVEKVEM